MNTNDNERLGLPSASAACYWNCAGQRNLMEACGNPESVSTDDSLRGDRIHKAFETGNTLLLDEEETETYKNGLKFLDTLLAGWQTDTGIMQVVQCPREERLWIHGADLEPIASAKLDRYYTDIPFESALIVDFKSGFVPNLVPSPKSTQLRVQAVTLKAEYPRLKRIRVAFCKAKLRYGGSDFCDYSEQDLAMAEQWVRSHIWQTQQPDAPRTPGRHCDYCPVKSRCREAAAYSMLPSVIAANAVQSSDFDPVIAVAQMAPVDLVKIWQSSGLITKILDAVKKRLKAMSTDELESLGLELGKGRENRNITDIKMAIEILKLQGWDEEQIFKSMEFSNTKLCKAARKEKGFSSDDLAKQWVHLMLSGAITTTVSEAPLKEME